MTSFFPSCRAPSLKRTPARSLPDSTYANCDASANGGSEAGRRAFNEDTLVSTARTFADRAQYA